MKPLSLLRWGLLCIVLSNAAAARADSTSVYLEDLTTAEVASAIRSGTTTIIIPVGGTEQNGPHMALGKHNARARILSGRIAQAVGKSSRYTLIESAQAAAALDRTMQSKPQRRRERDFMWSAWNR